MPVGGGTMLELTTTGDGSPLLGVIFYPAIKSDRNKSLNNLKAKLESAPR